MGQKSGKQKKDLTQLTEEEILRLTKNTTYSPQQIQDWHQGFLRYDDERDSSYRMTYLLLFSIQQGLFQWQIGQEEILGSLQGAVYSHRSSREERMAFRLEILSRRQGGQVLCTSIQNIR